MRAAAMLILGAGVAGCQSAKHDTSVPLVEEYRVAPDDAAYNNPPERGYTKPPVKKEFKPGMGGGAGGGGFGGGGPGR
jgi:hypothetical protein